jgi:hypothetical protein
MTEKEAILLLITYNDWSRGDEIPMPEPKQIGIAIDTVVNAWKQRNPEGSKTIKPILVAKLRLNTKIDEEVLKVLRQDYHVIIEFEDIESSKYEILECSY